MGFLPPRSSSREIGILPKLFALFVYTILVIWASNYAKGIHPLILSGVNKAMSVGGRADISGYPGKAVDLEELLGRPVALDGLLYDPYNCMAPFNRSVPPSLRDDFRANLQRGFVAAVAQVMRLSPESIDTQVPVISLLNIPNPWHERFVSLRILFSHVLANFALYEGGTRVCKCGVLKEIEGGPISNITQFGTNGCETTAEDPGIECFGAFPGMMMVEQSIETIVGTMWDWGFCSTNPTFVESFASWFTRERLYHSNWTTFNTNGQEDIILEMMDVLYEKHHIFLGQQWLGVTMMQDPFDFLSIQALLYQVKPDLIIETGTASGGSALAWASLLELFEYNTTRIITIDMNAPESGFGSEHAVKNPVDHPLWAKYVTFIQGYSTVPEVIEQVTASVVTASTVLVLLDSDHSYNTVTQELPLYCNMVTVGSYCIVEDTKMSRWTPRGGPLEAVEDFLKTEQGQNFASDRSRELLYSQHVKGYLKRIK